MSQRRKQMKLDNILNWTIMKAQHIKICVVQLKKYLERDLPGGTEVKNPRANAGDTGSSPGLGRSHMPRSS